jgi:hypothetical protein
VTTEHIASAGLRSWDNAPVVHERWIAFQLLRDLGIRIHVIGIRERMRSILRRFMLQSRARAIFNSMRVGRIKRELRFTGRVSNEFQCALVAMNRAD